MKNSLMAIAGVLTLTFGISETYANEIKGKVTVEDPAVISVIDFKGMQWPTHVNHLDSTFLIVPESKGPEIMTFFVTYKDPATGEKRQTYTPILVGASEAPIVIDVRKEGKGALFTTEDPNQNAFISFTDFIVENMNASASEKNPEEIKNKVDQEIAGLRAGVTDKLVSDYLELWGLSTKLIVDRLNHPRGPRQPNMNGGQRPEFPMPIDSLIQNKALKYFPEFVNVVTRNTAKGANLSERVTNLRQNLPEGDLRDYIETRLIVQYLNSNKGKLPAEEMIAQIDEVAKDRPERKEWVKSIKDYKPYLNRGVDAPEDILLSADGTEIKLADFKGKYLFIDFWASWCTYCVKEIPALEKIKNEFADSDIRFIGISLDENTDAWKTAMEKYGLEEDQFIVTSPEFASKLGLSAIPRYIIYDKEGKMLYPEAPRPRQYEQLTELLKSLS